MLISSNIKPSLNDFRSLVSETNIYLNKTAKRNEVYFLKRNAQKLEDDVADALMLCAKDTPFDNSILKVSGQKFPDIVAGKYYGIEVKSSTSENWTTLGGSINESTRVEDVERIFLTFGKLVSPVEFVSRPYEECLSEVVVTHYPRYKIDMNLTDGETIFDKIGLSYDKLRDFPSPTKKIIEYYKSNLKDGESLWWIDSGESSDQLSSHTSMTVKLWRTLTYELKIDYMISGFAFFPEILSNSPKKYDRYSLWLATHNGIVSTSMRDTFSAGGQRSILVRNKGYFIVPQALAKIHQYSGEIALRILLADELFLKEIWNVKKIEEDRIHQWINIICSGLIIRKIDVKEILLAIFNKCE